ncbi:MAG: hypothetical protein KGZ80_01730 [Methylomonas sp.]|nr:hypothetical protein [Methylomonas sp.]PPD22118.1 MAG: hypothetical protein CTY23_03430 [Methylomonas sp.]PPD42395.1 MAG: hypothetical protein CTY17_01240 [Methylomonas sp.]PPD53105.1 MAG: hypothetical protein CTY11_07320 [Methylomonas sp.]
MKNLIPWSLRGIGPFLNTYGDGFFFKSIQKTRPIAVNPDAPTAIHSAVPHRYLNAYLFAIKSFLRFHHDVAVIVHDDGSLRSEDYRIIAHHIQGVKIISRQQANETFRNKIQNDFLNQVRTSYTSYLKLFDSTLFSEGKRIVILDTDTLFIKKPQQIIDWCINGGQPWFHAAPIGSWKVKPSAIAEHARLQDTHIQTLISDNLVDINRELNTQYRMEQGFCSGFIGYEADTIKFADLHKLFTLLHNKFGDKIFLWGAEQTVHGLILCGKNAVKLPIEDYFVFTQGNASTAENGVFIHFVGENRFYKFIYPKMASKILSELPST